ncbi:hypothetical protein F4859DRAFT_521604 [Xylaria cf. heliscus]|nr:hypothetical protein F4859DRAFT_521604 [Xylaria cf. heliscus]
MEDAACNTCCSITGLSAYLADLLSLLKRTRSKESNITTLFEVLDKRRPNLKHLKLSCANSQTLIPYISLVNEVLKSYINYQYRLRSINKVFARQSAAKALDIQQAEFKAVTGETFFPSWFTDLLHVNEMVKETSGTRLSLSKAELMKRSGLEFQDVLELARSQCFSQDLVIVNKDGSPEFLNSLEDLLLLTSSYEPPFKELTEDLCFNLQAFLRLREKLKWTTRDLDAAIFSLRSHEMLRSPHASRPQATSFFSISPYVVKGISSVVKLSQLTGVEPADVLPLRGTMDAYGNKSFLYRRFFTPALQRVLPIFKPP